MAAAASSAALAPLASASETGAPGRFRRVSIEQGLSQSIVNALIQSRAGFLYLATEDGLNRYDGYAFTVYRASPGATNTLTYNELRAVCEDPSGALWIGTFGGGLHRFDPESGVFTRFRHDPARPDSLAADLVRAVLADRRGGIWVATQSDGLDRLDPASGTAAHLRHVPADQGSLASDRVRVLLEDREGALWIGTEDAGLDRLDPATGRISHFRHREGDPASLAADGVTALAETRDGVLWAGTAGGLCRLDRATGEFACLRADGRPGALPGDAVTALLEDHEGALWIGTDGNGLARRDSDTGAIATWRHNPADPASLSADRVRSLLEDRSRVLWVGTYGGGLSALDLTRKRFGHQRHRQEDPASLSHDIVWSFWEDAAGDVWIGTDSGGLNRLDRATGRYRHYRHDPADPSSIASDSIRVVAPSRDGTLWIGTAGAGLDRFDPATGRSVHHRHDPADPGSLAHDELRAVWEDAGGAVWVATYGGGLDRLDPVTGRFAHHRHDPADPDSIASDLVRGIREDGRGDLWIGTHGGGADRRDRRTGRFEHHVSVAGDPTTLGGNFVFSFLEDSGGALWVATYGGGISRFDRATGTFTRYTAADGLASDSTYGILEDAGGFLWISTNNGISRFDPRAGTFRTFDAADGLQSNEFNGGALYESRRGELFFGGIAGYNAFFPDGIGLNSEPPPVVVTELLLANRPVRVGETRRGRVTLTRPIEATDAVTVSYRDQVVGIGFAALHFTAPEKNRYAYRLEGFSDEWIPAPADRRIATFTGLAPGGYTFRVKAANGDGFWNERGATLRLTVEPPCWATWWFRLGALALLSAAAAAAYSRRVAHVRVVAELETAHDAQMAITPHADLAVPGFDVAGVCVAANEVGGDFFDYLRLGGPAGPPCIAVGDVSGKAMGAAMSAVMASGMVAALADGAGSLAEVMTSVNRVLHRKAPRHMFTALCLAALDREARTLTFVNAGLCPPLLRTGDGVRELEASGPTLPLGAFPDTAYEARAVALPAGAVVVIYSDGVPEALDRRGEQYGYARLGAFLAGLDTASLPARAIAAAVVADVARFAAGSRRHDDQAVVAIKEISSHPAQLTT